MLTVMIASDGARKRSRFGDEQLPTSASMPLPCLLKIFGSRDRRVDDREDEEEQRHCLWTGIEYQ